MFQFRSPTDFRGPCEWIVRYVLADTIQGFIIANEMFVIIALPDEDTRRTTMFINVAGGERFKPAYDFRQTMAIRTGGFIVGVDDDVVVGAGFKPPLRPMIIIDDAL